MSRQIGNYLAGLSCQIGNYLAGLSRQIGNYLAGLSRQIAPPIILRCQPGGYVWVSYQWKKKDLEFKAKICKLQAIFILQGMQRKISKISILTFLLNLLTSCLVAMFCISEVLTHLLTHILPYLNLMNDGCHMCHLCHR